MYVLYIIFISKNTCLFLYMQTNLGKIAKKPGAVVARERGARGAELMAGWFTLHYKASCTSEFFNYVHSFFNNF